jgi:hypothetical protein
VHLSHELATIYHILLSFSSIKMDLPGKLWRGCGDFWPCPGKDEGEMDRVDIVHGNFLRRVAARDLPAGRVPAGPLTSDLAVQAFRAGCLTRALDRQSRVMQRAGQGFYTIGS